MRAVMTGHPGRPQRLECRPVRQHGGRRLVLVGLAVVLCCGLAVWQWQRAQQQAGLAAAWQTRQQAPVRQVVSAPAVPVADWTGRRVVLHGQWHEARLWLDNVTEEDRPGRRLYGIFVLADGLAVLVERGFVGRGEAPPPASLSSSVSGIVQGWPGRRLVLAGPVRQGEVWQALTPEEVMAVWPVRLAPWLVREGAGTAVLPGLPAERHRAYAVQWAVLALVLAASGVFWMRRTGRPA